MDRCVVYKVGVVILFTIVFFIEVSFVMGAVVYKVGVGFALVFGLVRYYCKFISREFLCCFWLESFVFLSVGLEYYRVWYELVSYLERCSLRIIWNFLDNFRVVF